ncbi:hypothetical protein PZA22_13010 [Pectobacterium polaris]|uniref:hypothetical protein n=1 Tax=Pectobacterium polaris TaxID=2042057 RepID=UPI000E770707|nr:hypothetical protein [Pectobacterium polaris]MDE8755401.1 hypothetical protein [Pectobacterium polaris]RJL31497.1 hypothetical protein D5074_00455 [Pectobacterium polaris]
MTTCRICGLTYDPSYPYDVKIHIDKHKKLVKGIQPRMVREFSKYFGWAIAYNDGGIERIENDFDPELGKLVVVFSWWSRALENGVSQKDFDAYMDAHLKFADSLVSGNGVAEARIAIKKWEIYAG